MTSMAPGKLALIADGAGRGRPGDAERRPRLDPGRHAEDRVRDAGRPLQPRGGRHLRLRRGVTGTPGPADSRDGRHATSCNVLLAFSAYAFVTSITPGPSNLMLLASAASFGFVRTVPQMLGITAGFGALLLGVGLGLGAVLVAFPALHVGLKLAGGAYLLHLAWRIGTSRSLGEGGEAGGRPLTFLESAAFQWINPKAWVVAATAVAVYADPGAPFRSVALIAAGFALVNLPSVSAWAGFGTALRERLSDPVRLRWFNIAAGVLLAATLWPMTR